MSHWQTCCVVPTEEELLEHARRHLTALLPEYIELVDVSGGDPVRAPEALWELRAQNGGYNRVFVEAKRKFTPRDATRVHGGLSETARRVMSNPVILVVAPWLSTRSRELLERQGYSYIDLTGNVLLKANHPAIYLRLEGSNRDPYPSKRSPVRLQGPKARRLVRLLADNAPPYRLTDLADNSGLNRGYISNLLQAMDDQALIERDRRGTVRHVDWRALLLSVADRYDLFRNNEAELFVAPEGANEMFRRLTEESAPDVVVTGSFASVDLAPVAAPTQLVLYTSDATEVRRFGRLLPTDRNADVVLLRPEDPSQVQRPRLVDGRAHVALSQLVLDCLGGNGRLPEEGLAVLAWMSEHETAWRSAALPPAEHVDELGR